MRQIEIDGRIIAEAKANGQFFFVQEMLAAIGKSVAEGLPVIIRRQELKKPELLLATFSDYQAWLRDEHADILKM